MVKQGKIQESFIETGDDLVDAYRDIVALMVVEHTSLGASKIIISLVSLILVVIVFLFIGIGSAWWLGEYLNNMKAGFFIVGGVYSSVYISVVLTAKKFLIPKLRNFIIQKLYEQDPQL